MMRLNLLMAYAMNTKSSGIPCDSPDDFLVDSVGVGQGRNADVRFLGQNWIFCVFVVIFRKALGVFGGINFSVENRGKD